MVKFYLDLNLSGTSNAVPGVPSLDEVIGINTLPVIASTTCDVSKIQNLITFTTNNTSTYNWEDDTSDVPDFSDFAFQHVPSANAAAQESIFDSASDSWLSKFNSLEHNQYNDGTASQSLSVTQGTYTHDNGSTLHNNDGDRTSGLVSINEFVGSNNNGAIGDANKRSVSRYLANKIAQAVFNANLAYDIFDNEQDLFEECTQALENMAGTIAAGFNLDDTRTKYVGETLIARILAGHHGDASDNTTGGEPTRFSTIGDTTTATKIPLRAGDEIYVKCSNLTVTYTNPLDGSTTNTVDLSDSPDEDFLVLLILTGTHQPNKNDD